MSSIPSTAPAAILPHPKANPLVLTTLPVPHPSPSQVLIRIQAISPTPADVAVQNLGLVYAPETYPLVPGCDCAGEVVAVGDASSTSSSMTCGPENDLAIPDPNTKLSSLQSPGPVRELKVGDKVTTSLSKGSFQTYVCAEKSFTAKIPDGVEVERAAGLGLAIATSSVCLFEGDMLGLRVPPGVNRGYDGGEREREGREAEKKGEMEKEVLVVWGAGSALGSAAVQMGRAAGYEVFVIAGERSFSALEGFGVGKEMMADYHDEDLVDKVVAKLRGKNLAGAFCSIFDMKCIAKCTQIVGKGEGEKKVACVVVPAIPIQGPVHEGVEVLQCWHSGLNASSAARYTLGTWLSGALEDGSFMCPAKPEVMGRGLDKIQEAMDRMSREGQNAKRVVVSIP